MNPGVPDEPNDELLFRFVAGQCATPERVGLEAWLRRNSDNARRVEQIRHIWLASRPKSSRDVDRMWTRLRAAAEREQPVVGHTAGAAHVSGRATGRGVLARRPERTFAVGRWAAVLAVLVGGGALLVSRSRSAAPPQPPVAPHEHATSAAQTAKILLSDGTRIVLAPKSRLSVPAEFGARERVVSIQGEAFFDVVHNASLPFRVLAKGSVAEEIGTRFDMRAYDDEAGVVIIVAEGAVAIGRARSDSATRGTAGAVVRRGERARIGPTDSTIRVDHVSLRLVGWPEGRLSFVKTPLAEIARTIGRWYDLDVRVEGAALERRPITADFDSQSPREMIEALAIAVAGEVEQHGRVLTIRATRGASTFTGAFADTCKASFRARPRSSPQACSARRRRARNTTRPRPCAARSSIRPAIP
jgi:transmembrane sensor